MTDINFYVSKEPGLDQRLAIAYRLISKAIDRNLNTYIFCDTADTCKKVDKLLWTNEGNSFIPHTFINTKENSKSLNRNFDEIKIFHATDNEVAEGFEPIHDCDYLVNLSNQRPSFFSRFSKVAEIIDTNEEILTAGRKRYSFYRDRGYNLEYHKM